MSSNFGDGNNQSFGQYEPTTMIQPHELPTTDELPAVSPGPATYDTRNERRSGGRAGGVLAAILAGAFVAAAIIAAFLFTRSDDDQLVVDAPNVIEAQLDDSTAEPANDAPSNPVDGQPAYWTVVGVPDRLNVRSAPGTQSEVVGTLGNGDRHVYGTGQTADINGSMWVQVAYVDDAELLGWVSGTYLAPDTAPGDDAEPAATAGASDGPIPAAEQASSTVCFSTPDAPGRVAQLNITNRKTITGLLVIPDTPVFRIEDVSGTLDDGRADMTLADRNTGETRSQVWIFDPAAIRPGNEAPLGVIGCASIADRLP